MGAVVAQVALSQPVITTQPADRLASEGDNITLSVKASGVGPFKYQWRLNGSNLQDAIYPLAGNGDFTFAGDSGPATNASFKFPTWLALESSGNIYITDYGNVRIRKLGTNGFVSTVAGNGMVGNGGDQGPATNAILKRPAGLAYDAAGNLYIADSGNNLVRRVNSAGIISTFAGGGFGGDGGPATGASLSSPSALVADSAGTIYISDTGNNRVRKVDARGIINMVAGDGVARFQGDDGQATKASLNQPSGLALDPVGNLFISDSGNSRIRKVATNGIITTVGGGGANGFGGDGGQAISAQLSGVTGLATDGIGNLFLADAHNNRIRKISAGGIISTVTGDGAGGPLGGFSDAGGLATNAVLNGPVGLAGDQFGNLFFADSGNQRVRMLRLSGEPSFSIKNIGSRDAGGYDVIVSNAAGSVTSHVASVTVLAPPFISKQPEGLSVAIGDKALFEVSVVGAPSLSFQWYWGGTALIDQTNRSLTVSSVALTNGGTFQVVVHNSYGATTSAMAILNPIYPPNTTATFSDRIVSTGQTVLLSLEVKSPGLNTYQWRLNGTNLPSRIVTRAGSGTPGFSGSGGPATNVALSSPSLGAVDSSGNYYFSDYGNTRILMLTTNDLVIPVAGNGITGYWGDGEPATNAAVGSISGIAVDDAGNVFISEGQVGRIRKVGLDGVINALVADIAPTGLAVDMFGNLFAPTANYTVLRFDSNGTRTIAGDGVDGYLGDGGPGGASRLSYSFGGSVDSLANFYFLDYGNTRVRKLGEDGVISTVAGNGSRGYLGDGGFATNASFGNPSAITVDRLGDIFIADSGANVVRRVGTDGFITTVAGNGTGGYSGDGASALAASLNNPTGLAIDKFGNLFIADTRNNAIREVIAQGPTFVIENANADTSGVYSVVVSNELGATTNDVANLRVQPEIVLRVEYDGLSGLVLRSSGGVGQKFVLEVVTGLGPSIDWQRIYTNAVDVHGNWSYTNSPSSLLANQFYRLVSQ